jgi:hypothetical protein
VFIFLVAPLLRLMATWAANGPAATGLGITLPVKTDLGVIITPSVGGDDTANILTAYAAAPHGGTLYFRPSATTNAFKYSSSMSLTGTASDAYGNTIAKQVNIDGAGCVLYQTFATSGTQSGVVFGAPLGMSLGNVHWRRLSVFGDLTFQNINGCRELDPDQIVGKFTIQTDNSMPYNDFHIGSITGGLHFNQLTNGAWATRLKFHSTAIRNAPGLPAIVQDNPNATGPIGATFDYTDHEGDFPMFLLHNNVGLMFRGSYAEGSCTTTAGTISGNCTIQTAGTAHCYWSGRGFYHGELDE